MKAIYRVNGVVCNLYYTPSSKQQWSYKFIGSDQSYPLTDSEYEDIVQKAESEQLLITLKNMLNELDETMMTAIKRANVRKWWHLW